MENLKNSLLFKKVYGCLIGGSIGDAMGGPVETMHYKFIRQLYPGRVIDLLPYNPPQGFHQPNPNSGAYARSSKAGTYTDDTYLRHFITDAIIAKNGRISAEDLSKVWMEKMDTRYFWISISNSWNRIAMTDTPLREVGAGNIPDNSSAMCIGPIGIINAGDPAQAAQDAYEIASISHDGYAREAACVIASAVAEAMKKDATVDSIVKASVEFLPNRETSLIYGAVLRAIELANKVSDTEELTALYYETGLVSHAQRHPNKRSKLEGLSWSVDPLESIPCALAMFYKTNGDYKDGVIASANFGRDCDTIACMTGYIAGALNGVDTIPESWIAKVREANPEPDQEQIALGLTQALLAEKCRFAERISMITQLEETLR
ncbi:MAG: ADP-ribosylglycohydrolase family protein [Chloroflexi bacterium]|nr:ADP-ribosylglycohydrolase family protein [Chloroflexota bacterium]